MGAVAFAAAVWTTTAHAAAIFEIPTSLGFGADTHINFGSGSGNNNGTAVANGAQTAFSGATTTNIDSPFTARPILRFDLGGLPPGVITDAYFTFAVRFVSNPTVPISIFGLDDSHAQDAAPTAGGWEETLISADTAPSFFDFGTQVGQQNLTTAIPLTTSDPAPTFVQFTVDPGLHKDNLVDFLNSDTNSLVSFLMLSTSGSLGPYHSFSFWSKEGEAAGTPAAVAPTLTVVVEETASIPAPPAMLIVLAGALALVAQRRRLA